MRFARFVGTDHSRQLLVNWNSNIRIKRVFNFVPRLCLGFSLRMVLPQIIEIERTIKSNVNSFQCHIVRWIGNLESDRIPRSLSRMFSSEFSLGAPWRRLVAGSNAMLRDIGVAQIGRASCRE